MSVLLSAGIEMGTFGSHVVLLVQLSGSSRGRDGSGSNCSHIVRRASVGAVAVSVWAEA